MPIKYETEDQIPADERDQFEKFKEGDKDLFVHKDYAAAKREQFRLQGDVTRLTEQTDGMKSKLDELSAAEKKRQEEAEAERLKGMTDQQRLQEQVENLQKQVGETQAQYEARVKEATDRANSMAKNAVLSKVEGRAAKGNEAILRRMAAADLEMKDDGSFIVLDSDGKATTQTVDEYVDSLKDRYPSLVTAVQSKGGQGKGGAGGDDAAKPKFGQNLPGFNELPVS